MITYDELLLEALLFENQLDYLTRKYPEVDPALIQSAIDLDRKNAEKLVFGLKNGVISDIGPDSLEAVAGLDPFAKVSTKSESELAYDAAVRSAKSISPDYWQWIIRVRKSNPDVQFDEGLFHYLEAEGLKTEDIIDSPFDEIQRKADDWHRQQFADQQARGTYNKTPEKDAVFSAGAYSWVPVDSDDARTEGAKMQNCIGSYCNPGPDVKIFSLRNSYNNPHVSLSIKKQPGEKDWRVAEIKGKQNQIPVKKYVKYIIPFLEFLVKKNVDVTSSTDFWRLDTPDWVKFIKYHRGSLFDIPNEKRDVLSDELYNELMVRNHSNFPTTRAVMDSALSRLTPETIESVITSSGQIGSNTQRLVLKRAIILGRLPEENTKAMLDKMGVNRGVRMILTSRFRPDEFMAELKAIHPEDFVLARANYADAIEAYPYIDEYFTVLLNTLITQDSRDDELTQILVSKAPTADLIQLNAVMKGKADFHQYYPNREAKIHTYIILELFDRLTDKNIDAYEKLLAYMDSGFRFMNNYATKQNFKPNNIIFSVDFDDLPRLYRAGEHVVEFKTAIEAFMQNIGLAPGVKMNVLSGTTPDVAEATEFIMNTDDRDALMALRRQTKSRGVKIMVDRKIARLNRMQANARINEPEAQA